MAPYSKIEDAVVRVPSLGSDPVMAEFTMRDLQMAFYSHTVQRYDLLVPNVFPYGSACEMDLCGVRRSGFVDEIEIKASRSDYLADFKKTVTVQDGFHEPYPNGHQRPRYVEMAKHEAIQAGKGKANYFSFLLPRELADRHDDLPGYAGLYVHYVDNAGQLRVSEIKSAKRMHCDKLSIEHKYFLARKAAVKYWYK